MQLLLWGFRSSRYLFNDSTLVGVSLHVLVIKQFRCFHLFRLFMVVFSITFLEETAICNLGWPLNDYLSFIWFLLGKTRWRSGHFMSVGLSICFGVFWKLTRASRSRSLLALCSLRCVKAGALFASNFKGRVTLVVIFEIPIMGFAFLNRFIFFVVWPI